MTLLSVQISDCWRVCWRSFVLRRMLERPFAFCGSLNSLPGINCICQSFIVCGPYPILELSELFFPSTQSVRESYHRQGVKTFFAAEEVLFFLATCHGHFGVTTGFQPGDSFVINSTLKHIEAIASEEDDEHSLGYGQWWLC